MGSKTYPLPKGVKDAILNRRQLAEAMNTSENTIDKWRAAGMPVERDGTNGQSYEFKLSDCWSWKCSRDAEQRQAIKEADEAASQMRLHLIGAGDDSDETRTLSPKDRKELMLAEFAYQQAARGRGELIPFADVVATFDAVLSMVRGSVSGWPDRLQRELGLDPAQMGRAISLSDDLLIEVKEAFDKYCSETQTGADPGKGHEQQLYS